MPTKFIPFVDTPSIMPGLDIRGLSNSAADITDAFNGYFDVWQNNSEEGRRLKFVLRPKTIDSSLSLNTTNADQVINGWISSLDRTRLYFVLTGTGGPLFRYWDGTTTNNVAMTAGWSNTQGTKFDYLDGISYGANNYFVATDFAKGAVLTNAGVWTEIVSATYTGLTTKTNILPLDGYLFCGDGTTNRIYNSDLNVPGTWTATSFVTSADNPGKLLWLGRIRNYLVAFKQYSIEFWEDVGNPTPGSPLEAQKQLNRRIGLYSTSSMQEVSDGIIFLGVTQSGKISTYKIERDTLTIKDIGNTQVKWGLNNYFEVPALFSSYLNFPKTTSYIGVSQVINYKNKEFYCVSFASSKASSVTYLFDNELGVWVRWFSHFGSSASDTDGFFLPSQCVTLKTDSQYIGPVFAKNFHGTGTTFASTIQKVDPAPSSSIGELISFGFTTDFLDLNTGTRKFIDSLEILYELEYGASTSGATVLQFDLQYYDKSFKSTAATTRSISIKDTGSTRAIYRQLGNFRSRAFLISTTYNSPTTFGTAHELAICGFWLTYNDGETDQS